MLLEPFQANELSIQITDTLSPCAAGAIRCFAAACCMLLPRSAAAVAAAVAAADADADAVCPVAPTTTPMAPLLLPPPPLSTFSPASCHTCSPGAAKKFCDLR